MARTTKTVTGPVLLPNGTTPVNGKIVFTLSSWDRELNEVVYVPGPLSVSLDVSGNFSCDLFSNDAGENSTVYRVSVIHGTDRETVIETFISTVAVYGSGSIKLADLPLVSEHPLSATEVLASNLAEFREWAQTAGVQRLSGSQVIGKATTPADGTGGSGGVYVDAAAANAGGIVRSVQFWSSTAATVEIFTATRSTADVFTRVNAKTVSGAVGLNTFAVDLPINEGEYVGIYSATAGAVDYIAGTNIGYFYAATFPGGVFTDTVPSTGNQIQFKFDLDLLESAAVANFVADQVSETQIIGVDAVPITGDPAISGTLVLAETAKADGVLSAVEIYATAVSTVEIGVYERAGITCTRVSILARRTLKVGLNTIILQKPITRGQMVGFQCTTGGWAGIVAVTSGTPYWYTAATGASFDDQFKTSTYDVQVRVTMIKATTGQRHVISVANVDRIVGVGPSYMAGYYNPEGKNWLSKVSLFSPYNFDSIAVGGDTVAGQLARMRDDNAVGYGGIGWLSMAPTYTLICIGYNDFTGGSSVAFATYLANLRHMIETVLGSGSIPILAPEWREVYDASAHVAIKALTEEYGILFMDLMPHSRKMNAGTPYAEFWQSASVIKHPGVRTNDIIADPVSRFLAENLPRPRNAIKAFRLRSAVTVTDINADLTYRTPQARAALFKEINQNHVCLAEADEHYYDTLSNEVLYDQNRVIASEYIKWQTGGVVASEADYMVLAITLDAVARNISEFEINFGDIGIDLHIRAATGHTIPAGADPVYEWAALTGTAGRYVLTATDLKGRVDVDTIHLLIHKTGGFSLPEPRMSWVGVAGKSLPAPRGPVKARGAELLNVTTVSALTGNRATGWDDEGGTITPSANATYQLPRAITHWVAVTDTLKLRQTLDYTTNEVEDVEVLITVTARRFPARVAAGGSYPAAYPINQDSYDWSEVVVELINPAGTYAMAMRGKVGLWWDDVQFRAILPVGVTAMDIRVSGDSEIQVAEVSVKTIE